MYMSVTDLNREQLEELKQHYYCERNENVSWGELACIDSLVSDEEIYQEYDGTLFTEDDFFCKSNKEEEIKFVKDYMIGSSDFRNCYIDYNKSDKDFNTTIDELLDYIFYSEFNPYLDVEYLDVCWLKNHDTGKIYNVDDMWQVYKDNLMEEE